MIFAGVLFVRVQIYLSSSFSSFKQTSRFDESRDQHTCMVTHTEVTLTTCCCRPLFTESHFDTSSPFELDAILDSNFDWKVKISYQFIIINHVWFLFFALLLLMGLTIYKSLFHNSKHFLIYWLYFLVCSRLLSSRLFRIQFSAIC